MLWDASQTLQANQPIVTVHLGSGIMLPTAVGATGVGSQGYGRGPVGNGVQATMKKNRRWMGTLVGVIAVLSGSAFAQTTPWVTFLDDETGELCDVVNTADAEFVVLADTGELVFVSEEDFIVDGVIVDDTGVVYWGGVPSGNVDFADDAFGFRKLFWFDFDGLMIGIDPNTGDFVSTTVLPDEIDGVCAACERWDDPFDCGGIVDSDDDGVEDNFDFCDDTPFDEIADADGCSCSQLDSDQDEIDDCLDECPDSIPGDIIDDFGCGCTEFDDDDDGVNDCFDECLDTPIDEQADEFGCSCSNYDDDEDGVDNCFDECPDSDFGDDVDFDGCADGDVIVVDPIDIPIVISCGNFSSLTMMGLVTGLMSMGLGRRRRIAA